MADIPPAKLMRLSVRGGGASYQLHFANRHMPAFAAQFGLGPVTRTSAYPISSCQNYPGIRDAVNTWLVAQGRPRSAILDKEQDELDEHDIGTLRVNLESGVGDDRFWRSWEELHSFLVHVGVHDLNDVITR